MNKIICENINTGDLSISESELACRLKSPEPLSSDAVSQCLQRLMGVCRPRYCCAKTSVSLKDEQVTVDFALIKSKNLAKNLEGCSEAYVMAVTLGIEADRYINTLGALSKAQAFIADAVSSAMAEAAAEYVSSLLGAEHSIRPRYSPGYGDLKLDIQTELLGYLNADKLIGIKLGDNLLMTPRKSITAFCGIERK